VKLYNTDLSFMWHGCLLFSNILDFVEAVYIKTFGTLSGVRLVFEVDVDRVYERRLKASMPTS